MRAFDEHPRSSLQWTGRAQRSLRRKVEDHLRVLSSRPAWSQRSMLDCILPIASPISFDEGGSLPLKRLTSRTTTTRPSARLHKSFVIRANPDGVTLHSPSGSPSAASNPADTSGAGERMRYTQKWLLTKNNFWSELFCDRHYYPLKRINIVSVAFSAP